MIHSIPELKEEFFSRDFKILICLLKYTPLSISIIVMYQKDKSRDNNIPPLREKKKQKSRYIITNSLNISNWKRF